MKVRMLTAARARVEALVPEHHRTNSHPHRQARLFVWLVLSFAVVHLLAALWMWGSGVPAWWWPLAGWFVIYGAPLLLLQRSQEMWVPANLLTAGAISTMVVVSLATGGIASPDIVLLLPLPMLAATLSDRRSGLAWGLLVGVAIVVMSVVGPLDSIFPQHSHDQAFAFMVGLMIALALLWFNEESRDQAEAELREASLARTRFLAMMSHEIRTPMNGILGMAQLLSDTRLSAEQEEQVTLLQGSGESLMLILNDILDFAKLESGQMSVESIPMDLRTIAHQSAQLIQPLAQDKLLALSVSVDPVVPDWVAGDPGRLRQVLLNLLSNAVKFTPRGQVSLQVRQGDGDQTCIDITDTGIGIRPEHQAHLFEPFTQAEAAISRLFGGTGLGLAISKQLVEQMGGRISVESTLGAGSCFTVTLPLPPSLAPSPVSPPKRQRLGGLQVLLAEDHAINQRLVTILLEKLGASVTLAEDGAEAVSAWQRGGFDVVLMDMQMPGTDGLEATRLIRSAEPQGTHIPIIALTANAGREHRDACRDAGMDAFLTKPVQKAALVSALTDQVGLCTVPPTRGRPRRLKTQQP